ncbi:MAG: alanine--tRNA ligase [Chloroflexi bacterium]|nr:alanine--tRNA ligase [Chloroflexota bacterium]
METMTSAQVRQSFVDFFVERGHTVVPSAGLVPADDPTLLFTNAGMNQFKDVFLGIGTRPYTRAVNMQKCLRVSGKHNDLDEVGRDETHHTLFEMLGNWSFGDYYKKEAIAWAWEFLTDTLGLSRDRLWASVFEDELGQLETDQEAAEFWRTQTTIDPDHIVYFGRKDNFWEMADVGPCGPNSEIIYDHGPEACRYQDDPQHICQVNGDCGRFVEFWNLVFIQYDRDADGNLTPLPAKHVDTGLGFERLAAIMQGVQSNYQTDLFVPIIERTREMAGHSEAQVLEDIVPYRVIADHSRAIAFLIGDGVLPGNEGRNYVLRMILRRAVRFGRKLGFVEPFLAEVAETVVDVMGAHYPELQARRQFILSTITQEEKRFLRTVDTGLARLDEVISELLASGKRTIPGEAAFRLYDTFGLPLEITRDVGAEHGLGVDEAAYRVALEAQRQRARGADTFDGHDESTAVYYGGLLASLRERGLLGEAGVVYDPYSTTEVETLVAAVIKDGELAPHAAEGDRVSVVLQATCFYVESGGQVSDTGFLAAYSDGDDEPVWEIEVTDVKRPVPALIIHEGVVTRGRPRPGDGVWAVVNYDRRMDVARNHTATHLLQSELRYLLGEHVQQAGSAVSPDRLRFDFTHPGMLTQDDLDAVTRSVNDAILANYPVEVTEESYRGALKEGVIALFGEKYGESVRVVRVGWPDEPFSQELCGGTHVSETGEIGIFQIVSEEGVGAGVRRIEAVTGRGAMELIARQLGVLQRASAYLGVPPDEVDRKALGLIDDLQLARKEISRLQEQLARREFDALLEQVQTVAGVSLLSARVAAQSLDVLREMTDWFRERLESGVVVLGAVLGERPALITAVTDDLVLRGIDAAAIVRRLARVVGGGGGGKPTLAQAGGRDATRLDEALAQAPFVLAELMD